MTDGEDWFDDNVPGFGDFSSTWYPGAEIDGCYQLIELLSEGGFGTVWKAKETVSGDVHETGRVVAIKVFHAKRNMDSWIAEFTSFASLSNRKGIVTLFRAGKDCSGRPFIVTEFVKGNTLHERISRGLSLEETRKYLQQLAKSIVQLHRPIINEEGESKLIVHCDLKPSNIMICDENDEVIILDLGAARVIHENSISTAPIGSTELYKVPEANLEPAATLNQQQDIFQFGLIGFEMLTGKRYWECEDRVRNSALQSLVTHFHPIQKSTCNIVQISLQWDPQSRYANSKQVLRDFSLFRTFISLLTPITKQGTAKFRTTTLLLICLLLFYCVFLFISNIKQNSIVRKSREDIRNLETEICILNGKLSGDAITVGLSKVVIIDKNWNLDQPNIKLSIKTKGHRQLFSEEAIDVDGSVNPGWETEFLLYSWDVLTITLYNENWLKKFAVAGEKEVPYMQLIDTSPSKKLPITITSEDEDTSISFELWMTN